MGAKAKTVYACQECGASTPRWLGRCPTCQAWNSLVEERAASPSKKGARRGAGTGSRGQAVAPRPVPLADVSSDGAARFSTGLVELDRVLGGGLVGGAVVLLGGEPGIGKSTLLMQVLAGAAAHARPLYVTGEESASQVALRGRRLGGEGMASVEVLSTCDLDDVLHALDGDDPGYRLVVVDSVQTLRSSALDSAAGSVGQVREVAAQLVELAKSRAIALWLIGHVTKDGALAGPKVLEHLVDTVLSFEGDRSHAFRVVRASKNRFGPAQEIAVFEMLGDGLREVSDPSALLLAERPVGAAGSVVAVIADGHRPMLVEVQALLAPALYGAARRVAAGLEGNRLAILLAVLERKADVHVLDRDVFASVAGGLRVDERGIDLPLCLAVVSSLRERPVDPQLAAFGELGLAGEVRAVPRPGPRVAEARKLGFRRVMLPKGSVELVRADEGDGVELIGVATVSEALAAAF